MLRRVERLVGRIAAESTRPDWTLFAIAHLFSEAFVLVLRSVLGV
jgi:hypothetical protein